MSSLVTTNDMIRLSDHKRTDEENRQAKKKSVWPVKWLVLADCRSFKLLATSKYRFQKELNEVSISCWLSIR